MSELEFLARLIKAADKAEKKSSPDQDKISIKLTFIDGGEIVIPDEQWDDYRYDGKFFTIVKDGTDIAMYNASTIFSLVLINS